MTLSRSRARPALDPVGLLALSLVLHELTTNAVEVRRTLGSGGTPTIDWGSPKREGESYCSCGGPRKVGPQGVQPARPGFGGQLIEFTISHEFGGTSER